VRPERVREGNDLAVIFQVDEGEAMVVGPIEVRGASRTRLGLVRRQLGLQAGRPVDPRQLAEAERRLLDLGVFSRASLRVEPVEPAPAGAGPRPARVVVEVEEDATIVAGYDLRWNEDDRLTALVEGERRNLAGIGLALGARYRFGADIREARGSLHLPALLRGADFTGSVFSLEEDIHVEDLEITRRQRGFQVQQTLRLPHRSRLLLGYRFRRNTVLAPDFPAEPIDVGGADLSVVQDTLDNHLDASRGRFLSLNLEVAPAALGSDAPFVKGFAQALLAHPVAGPSLTWAHSYRVGLAWGLGGEPLNPLERFMAGGPSSLRGFATNAVGPRDVFGDPAGGAAVAILNQELRFRHASGLGAVVFYDAGNVFPTVDELRFDLRHTAGLGLRWTSPVGLLRLDLGFPLGRREGEKGYRLFFGVGQAF
jgi:outer membrane protein assembly factor BamA